MGFLCVLQTLRFVGIFFHMSKSCSKPLFSLILKLGLALPFSIVTVVTARYNLPRNGQPLGIALHKKLSVPVICCIRRTVIFPRWFLSCIFLEARAISINSTALSNLSCGICTTCLTKSTNKPKNVMAWTGPTVFFAEGGRRCLHTIVASFACSLGKFESFYGS